MTKLADRAPAGREHYGLAVYCARRFYGRGVPREELIGEAEAALLWAASRFDPDRGIRFSTYAIPFVLGALRELCRRAAPMHVPRADLRVMLAAETAREELRRRGGDKGEYGATTGRPRRVGWFDTVATKYGCTVQGATEVALTCLDVLGYLDEIPVCVGYEIDGKVTTTFPVPNQLVKAKPVFEKLPGWKCDIRGITDYDALPENAKKYVEFLESKIGVPIKMVSTGPKRHEMTYRK